MVGCANVLELPLLRLLLRTASDTLMLGHFLFLSVLQFRKRERDSLSHSPMKENGDQTRSGGRLPLAIAFLINFLPNV